MHSGSPAVYEYKVGVYYVTDGKFDLNLDIYIYIYIFVSSCVLRLGARFYLETGWAVDLPAHTCGDTEWL